MALTAEDVDRQIAEAFVAFQANVEEAIITGVREYSARPASTAPLPLSPVTVISSDPTAGTTVAFDTDPSLTEVPVQAILGAAAGQRGLVLHSADGGGYLLPFSGAGPGGGGGGGGGGGTPTGALLGSASNPTTNVTTIASDASVGYGVFQLSTTFTQTSAATGLEGVALNVVVNQTVSPGAAFTPQGGYASPWFDGTHAYPSIMQGPMGRVTTQGVTTFTTSGVDMPVIFQSFEVFKNAPGAPINFATSAMFNLSPQIVADGAACRFAPTLASFLPQPDAAPDWMLAPYGQIMQGGFAEDPWYGTINGGSLHNNVASGNAPLASVGFWTLPVFYGDVTMATRVDFLANEIQAWTDTATSAVVHTPSLDRHVGFMAQRSTFATTNISAVFNNSVEYLDQDRTFTDRPFKDAGFVGLIGFGGAALSMNHNYTLNYANAMAGAFVQANNTWSYQRSMSALGHGAFAQNLATIKNAVRTITGAAVSPGGGTTSVLSKTNGDFTAGDVGASVFGPGIPAGTTISNFINNVAVNLSAPSNITAGTGLSVTIAANVTFTNIYGFLDQTTIAADRVALNAGTLTTFFSFPTFTELNGGSFTTNAVIGFQSGASVAQTAVIFSRVGFRVSDATGTGTVSSQIGVLIDNLSFANGPNIGLLNNATTVYGPQSQTVSASVGIAPTATLISISSAADVALPNPNIGPPQANGQFLRVVNVGAHNVTFTNGFGVFLSAPLTLAPGSTASFIYIPTLAQWTLEGASGATTSTNVLRVDGIFNTVTGSFGAYGTQGFGLPNNLTLRFAQGTAVTPTRVLAGNVLGGIVWQGYNDIDAAYDSAASVNVLATGDFHTAGQAPAVMQFVIGGVTAATISSAGVTALSLLASSATGGFGYATGAGGTVAQATSKSTGVTLNKMCGRITMNNAALAASTSVGFTLTDSSIAATDGVKVWIVSGATNNAYFVVVDAVAAGSCHIHLRNTSLGSLSEAVVVGFAVIKAVTA